ncbi:MAG: prepilin-type N-terminal cleavage/methylation domain-containing protein [Deltaproteobacteria bacterium]|nr:prepilin-type N-terminal cleavage/methylation domain-containing protein [Deltaproteobacteria bacterium]
MARRGFTLIEMMVALVVAGLVMASLVALSGSVQRSFGRTRDITLLQANLRMATRLLIQDLRRASYMYSSHCMGAPNPPPELDEDSDSKPDLPVAYDALADQFVLRMKGNYISSRDYRYDPGSNNMIVCRNGMDASKNPLNPGGCMVKPPPYDEDEKITEQFLKPFGDGPEDLEHTFPDDCFIRVENRGGKNAGKYSYHKVTGHTAQGLNIEETQRIVREEEQGETLWINPISEVVYTMKKDGDYDSPAGILYDAERGARWILTRDTPSHTGMEIAEFLLPLALGGVRIEAVEDDSVQICTTMKSPNWQPPKDIELADMTKVRAIVVSLRARTELEDPDYGVADYNGNQPAVFDYALNLDTDPGNGLAYVRTERAVVMMQNLVTDTQTW